MIPELNDQALFFVTVTAIGRTLMFFGVGTMFWRWLQWSRRREALGELLYRNRPGRFEVFLILVVLVCVTVHTGMLAWGISRVMSDRALFGGIPLWLFEPLLLGVLLIWCLAIHCILSFFMPVELRATGCCTGGWRLVPWSRMTQGVWGVMPVQTGWERLVRGVRRTGRDKPSGEEACVPPPSAKHILVLDSDEVLPVTFWVPKSQVEALEEVAGRFVPIVDVEPRPRYAHRRHSSCSCPSGCFDRAAGSVSPSSADNSSAGHSSSSSATQAERLMSRHGSRKEEPRWCIRSSTSGWSTSARKPGRPRSNSSFWAGFPGSPCSPSREVA